ncbi:F0F1 ATP synthase subunit A [Hydrotalea sp.]|nr:F0F1 ATP synthase subunit A [Hydrotalea sp.]
MPLKYLKSLLVVAFSLFFCSISFNGKAQVTEQMVADTVHEKSGTAFNPGEVIMEHIMDNHEFHFAEWNGHPIAFPLPVIVYSPQKGLSVFISSKLEHGHAIYDGYKLEEGTIVAVNEAGEPDTNVKVYDLSLTRNVVQMLLGLLVLVIVLINVGKKYTKEGASKAPSGFQNAIEPVITFIRDEVGKSYLGNKYEKYMPLLLTIFFFILISTLFGLIPGSANVTGNIAFTFTLGIISFVVILFSANKHYWTHIFNPPGVPTFVKFILIPVEILSVFTKPFALIVRLFANMVAGHMIITCLILMIFIFSKLSIGAGLGFAPVSLAFTIFIYFIEILVAFIQAFIFTNLTAVFIGQAIEDTHSHHDDAVMI